MNETSEIISRLRDVQDGYTAIDDSSDLPKLAADALEASSAKVEKIRAWFESLPDGQYEFVNSVRSVVLAILNADPTPVSNPKDADT